MPTMLTTNLASFSFDFLIISMVNFKSTPNGVYGNYEESY